MESLYDKLRDNDPSVREVDNSLYRGSDARILGEALCGNTHVERLAVDVSLLNGSDLTNGECAPLLQFLRTSSTLGMVSFRAQSSKHSRSRQHLAEQCLLTIASNSGTNIKTLVLKIEGGCKVPTAAFATLIGKTKSIQTLDVGESDFQDAATTEELKDLHDAVLGNKSILDIDMRWIDSTVVSEALVAYLGHHACLKVLNLSTIGRKATASQMQALASMLSATKTLERLKLSVRFDNKDDMDCLVEGLKANESLIELSFSHDHYNSISAGARQSLADYMQSPKQGHSIRELLLLPWSFCDDRRDDYSTFVVSMLALPEEGDERHTNKSQSEMSLPAGSSTVGSSLQLLEFTMAGPNATFYRAFAEQAARIPLPSLKIDSRMEHFELFHSLLPQLIHLREFIAPSDGYAESVAFVRALKTNGSFSNVIIADSNRDLSQGPLKRLINAYCQRNATLPVLLSKVQGDDDSGDGLLVDNTSANSGTNLSQLPTLFLAAQQASVTAPTLVLTGLFAAGERLEERSIGKSANKRVLSE